MEGTESCLAETIDVDRERLLGRIRAGMGPLLTRLHDPEDVLQDTLVVALRSLGRLRSTTREGTRSWVLAIARNRILDLSRQGRRRERPWRRTALPPALLASPDPRASDPPAREPTTDAGMIQREEAEVALRALGALAPDQRLCVVLRDLLGLPWQRVAFALRRSRPAARKLHARAHGRLVRRASGTRSGSSVRSRVPVTTSA